MRGSARLRSFSREDARRVRVTCPSSALRTSSSHSDGRSQHQQFSVRDLSTQLRFGLLYLGGFDVCRVPAPDRRRFVFCRQSRSAVRRCRSSLRSGRGCGRSRQALRTWNSELKIAMLPPEFSPVIRKRTVRGPSRMISFEGFTLRSAVCCAICASANSKVRC